MDEMRGSGALNKTSLVIFDVNIVFFGFENEVFLSFRLSLMKPEIS